MLTFLMIIVNLRFTRCSEIYMTIIFPTYENNSKNKQKAYKFIVPNYLDGVLQNKKNQGKRVCLYC